MNEAASAIKMAHVLMQKYGLDKEDFELIKMGKTQSHCLLPESIDSHTLRVIRGINSKFGVEAILLSYKGLRRIKFIGEVECAIFAAFAFDVVYREMKEHTGRFRSRLSGSIKFSSKACLRINSFVSGWTEGALEKLPEIAPGKGSKDKIKRYIEREFKTVDRETFRKHLKRKVGSLTEDYELGLQRGREVSVNRPIDKMPPRKQLESQR